MTSVIRFHLDEHVSSAIALALRRRGIDVTTAVEAGLAGVDDHVQLAFAFQEARVMVTRDADFLRLHASRTPHAGIVYYPQTSRTVGQVY